MVEVLLG